jgi:hypothetical protein
VIRAIPSFADLMLLPGIVERSATVFLKRDKIAVETRFPVQIVKEMSVYPHVRVSVDAEGHVILEAREARHRRLLLIWPSGRSEGALLWERGFFSSLDASVVTALLAAGCAVETVRCDEEESLVDVLERLPRIEPEPWEER